MSSSSKLLALSLIVGGTLAALIAACVLLFSHAISQPRMEAMTSAALGMEVKIGGKVSAGFLPSLHIVLTDVRVRVCGADIASAGEVDLGIEFLPLLRQQVRIDDLAFARLTVSVGKNLEGKPKGDRPCRAATIIPAFAVPRIAASGLRFTYTNQQSEQWIEAADCQLWGQRLVLSAGASEDVLKNLSVTAQLRCSEIRTKEITASDASVSISGKRGIVDFAPVAMRLFGGRGSGNVHADFTGDEPTYRARLRLAQFRIEEFFKSFAATNVGNGSLDFSADVSLRGKNKTALLRTVAGGASVRGTNLTLNIGDVDARFSRYEDSQRFNLVDVGAFLFAGPLGLGITKGFDFARNFQGTRGITTVRDLVSEWRIEHGVADAQDVAMATPKNRIVLRGRLNFATQRYDQVTVALVDAKGCLAVQQKVSGSFLSPNIEPPTVVKSLTGPTRRVFRQVRELFGGKCTVFYAGSVAPPK